LPEPVPGLDPGNKPGNDETMSFAYAFF
jgi:hypothetical protein